MHNGSMGPPIIGANEGALVVVGLSVVGGEVGFEDTVGEDVPNWSMEISAQLKNSVFAS